MPATARTPAVKAPTESASPERRRDRSVAYGA
jgi:hypothetical protein